MQLKENKSTWISLFIVSCVILLFIFSIFELSPLIKATIEDWSKIQNSSSITQNDKDKLNASLDTLRTIGIVAAPISTIAGAFVLFLNFTVGNRTAEIASRNAEIASRTAEITESRLITERFSKAVEQLGSDTLEVCLGGIYSLEKIATDSNSSSYYSEIVMELLTAFIRETSNLIYGNKVKVNDKTNSKNPLIVQVALNVVGKLNSSSTSHGDLRDLMDANLVAFALKGNFSKFNFAGATIRAVGTYKVVFKESIFHRANVNNVYMGYADFQSTDFGSANLSHSNFENANFQDCNLMNTNLSQSIFKNANFQSADLRGADLRGADLEGADLEGADLEGADLRGVDLKSFDNILITDVSRIQAANNYEKARYNDDLRQQLNIPDA